MEGETLSLGHSLNEIHPIWPSRGDECSTAIPTLAKMISGSNTFVSSTLMCFFVTTFFNFGVKSSGPAALKKRHLLLVLHCQH